MANDKRLVTIFGGSGFVGRYVVRELARRGWRVKIACRHPERAGFLQPFGEVGQIRAVAANIRDLTSIQAAIEGADAIVNLVGILAEGGAQKFNEVHTAGTRRLAEAAKGLGISNFVQMSAIGADAAARARYAGSKGRAEAQVLELCPSAVVLRPSIIFGEEDDFFNRFAAMARISPFLPAIGGGRTKFQPVYVGDVAAAVGVALDGGAKPGTTYELGGPTVYSFAELLHMTQRLSGRKERNFPIPFWMAKIQGAILQVLPGKVLTLDQVRMLKTDNVVSPEAIEEGRTLDGLGITPTSVESVVPLYLAQYKPRGMFSGYRHLG